MQRTLWTTAPLIGCCAYVTLTANNSAVQNGLGHADWESNDAISPISMLTPRKAWSVLEHQAAERQLTLLQLQAGLGGEPGSFASLPWCLARAGVHKPPACLNRLSSAPDPQLPVQARVTMAASQRRTL